MMEAQILNHVVKASDRNFEHYLESYNLVLADFWATWCPPCRAQNPILDNTAQTNSERIKTIKIDVDESPTTARTYGIRSLPTLIVFKNGKPVKTLTGLQSQSSIQTVLNQI